MSANREEWCYSRKNWPRPEFVDWIMSDAFGVWLDMDRMEEKDSDAQTEAFGNWLGLLSNRAVYGCVSASAYAWFHGTSYWGQSNLFMEQALVEICNSRWSDARVVCADAWLHDGADYNVDVIAAYCLWGSSKCAGGCLGGNLKESARSILGIEECDEIPEESFYWDMDWLMFQPHPDHLREMENKFSLWARYDPREFIPENAPPACVTMVAGLLTHWKGHGLFGKLPAPMKQVSPEARYRRRGRTTFLQMIHAAQSIGEHYANQHTN